LIDIVRYIGIDKMIGDDYNQQLEYQAQQTFRSDEGVSICSEKETNPR
jgi:hypothetical protein